MKKIGYVLLIIIGTLFIGVSTIFAKEYTIEDYIDKLQNNSLTGSADSNYDLSYNEETGEIKLSSKDNSSSQSGNFEYIMEYDEEEDKITHVNNQTSNELKITDSLCSMIAMYALFEMHGYDLKSIQNLGVDNPTEMEKYGVKVESQDFEYNNTTEVITTNFSGDLITKLEMDLNGMEDYVAPVNTEKSDSTNTESSTSNNNSVVENPKTIDINPYVIGIGLVGLILIIIYGKKRLCKINK